MGWLCHFSSDLAGIEILRTEISGFPGGQESYGVLSQAAVAWSRISDLTPGSSGAAIIGDGRLVAASAAPIISRLLIRNLWSYRFPIHLLRDDASPAITSFRIILSPFLRVNPTTANLRNTLRFPAQPTAPRRL